ncbi:MAG: hypothetical protein J6M18_02450 [Actinomycetaceae bacterium]|nr:hypothetical protein [Actinomycetaceae bacterium]
MTGFYVFSPAKADTVTNDSYDNLVVQIVNGNPGVTYAEIDELIKEEANSKRVSPHVIAQSVLQENNKDVADVQKDVFLFSEERSSGGGNVQLVTARQAGDIFYSPSSTAGVKHGHAGIYSTKTQIIEAEGPGKKVHYVSKIGKKFKTVARGTQIMYVKTTQAKRNAAVKRARGYIGRSYKYNFAFNKTESGAMNCSQLVWSAYKNATGIDLDGDGGHGIYPKDFTRSKWTVTYAVVR